MRYKGLVIFRYCDINIVDMKIISFIHRGFLNNKTFDSIVEQAAANKIDKIVVNTVDLLDKILLNKVLNLQETFRDIDVIVKEIVREDFLGGVLSTLQLFERGEFLVIDMDCNLGYIDINKFFGYNDALGVSRKVRCEYIYSFEVDGDGNIVNVHSGLKDEYVFCGIAKLGEGFLEALRRLLILYYNPDYIKFENLITTYLRRGGVIKAIYMD